MFYLKQENFGMYCSKCGKKTDDSGRYCQWCGADLKATPPKPLLRRKVAGIRTEDFAGPGQRFIAFVIDVIFILIIDAFVMGVTGLTEGVRMAYQLIRGYPMTDRYGDVVNSALPTAIVYSFTVLIIIVPWIYFAFLDSSKNQATLGKIAARVAITDMNGARITFARGTLHFFAMYLSFFIFFVGFIITPFTRQKQGLHDIIAGCLMFRQ
jgi:uncharacterized RDD family membrane protein YckC